MAEAINKQNSNIPSMTINVFFCDLNFRFYF